jgi:hypothetical protein
MNHIESWTQIGVCDEHSNGTLYDVLLRWKNMESIGDEAILGVTLAAPIKLEDWDAARTDLWPEHLAQLVRYLDQPVQHRR